jgi:formylglycine-generating enzyme required for sulfatase activity
MVITNRLEGEPDVTIQRALILSLGEFRKEAWPPGKFESLVANLQEIYDKTSDPGVHAAAEWVLRQRQQDVWLKQLNAQWAQDKDQREKRLQSIGKVLAKGKEKAPPQWYVNGQGQTMVVIPGPMEFLMGSPLTEKDRLGGEGQHRERIERTFAMASKAVTVSEYRRFDPTHALTDDKDPKLGYPVVGTSWYEAAAYCNWLSKEEGIDRNQFCYETTPQGQVTRLRPKYLSLTGYRLPTEAEMEFAIRAGAVTSRYYGEPKELLGNYGWFTDNSEASVWPVGRLKPNDLGLFDMHGNVWCWCQETFHAYPRADRDKVFKDSEFELAIEDKDLRALRGDCYTDHAPGVRSASRWQTKPTDHSNLVGFRPARTISAE